MTQSRIAKAEALAASGTIVQANGAYFCPGSTYPGTYYMITLDANGAPTCTCPWNPQNVESLGPCSHRIAVGLVVKGVARV